MAIITAVTGAAGNWTAGSAWVGGVAPTSADDAVISNLTTSLTINTGAVCRSADFTGGTGFTGTLTHTAAVTFNIGDSGLGAGSVALKLNSGMTYTLGNAQTSAISFVSTNTGQQTITTAGKTLGNITINGAGSSYKLMDNLTISGTWTCTAGTTLDTTTNSAIITIVTGGFTFAGGGKTYYSLVIGTGSFNVCSITGANTFNTFTFTGQANNNTVLSFNANQTITGTLTVTGNNAQNQRVLIQSTTLGTSVTITAATVSINNVDFQDIAGAGAANWNFSGITTIGNCGGNTGITFTASVTQYFRVTATGVAPWSTVGNWFLATGGGGGAGRVPLPHDDVVIDANSIANGAAGSTTIQYNCVRSGRNVNFTGVTNSPILTITSSMTIYGSLTLVSAMSVTGTLSLSFNGRGSFTIISAGQILPYPVIISAFGGTYALGDALTISNTLSITNGVFDAQNVNINANVTATGLSAGSSLVRGITMGSGTWTLTGTGNTWNTSTTNNLTFNKNTSTIILNNSTNATINFVGGGLTFYNVWFQRGASTATNTISGSNSFNDFKDTGTAAHSLLITAGTTQTFATFTVSGSSGNAITINSTTTATFNFVKTGGGTISCDWLNISHCIATPWSGSSGVDTWYAGANSVNNQSVATIGTGWIFTASPLSNSNFRFFMFM